MDECASGDAQAEIIKIIASSIWGKDPLHSSELSSAALNFVLFPHSNRTASLLSLNLLTTHNYPSLARQMARLKFTEFKNILNNDLPQLLPSWPTDNDIRMLIDAADLFAHPTVMLRHVTYLPTHNSVEDSNLFLTPSSMQENIDLHHPFRNSVLSISWSRFQRAFSCLQNALCSIFSPGMLTTHSYASMLCCMVIISEQKDICNHLHVAIFYEVSYDPLGSIDPRIDLTWLARIVFQPFLVFSPAKGTVGFIKLNMGKGRWYGEAVSPQELLTMRRL